MGPGPGGPAAGSAPAGGPPPDGAPPAGLPRGIGDPVLESGAHPPSAPVIPRAADRSRPVYPYPYTTLYKGTGSIDDAANFVRGPAKPVVPRLLDWFGAGFYKAHYESWCTGEGKSLHCAAKP